MPKGTKASLIKDLVHWMCETKAHELIYWNVLTRVPKRALLGHLNLHGHRFPQNALKSVLADAFRMSDCHFGPSMAPADRVCTALVPVQTEGSIDRSIVPACPSYQKRLRKYWAKKAQRFMARKNLSGLSLIHI